jgi:hypothetical protein
MPDLVVDVEPSLAASTLFPYSGSEGNLSVDLCGRPEIAGKQLGRVLVALFLRTA